MLAASSGQVSNGNVRTQRTFHENSCETYVANIPCYRSDLLTNLTSIAEALPEGQGQLARACYKLSIICTDLNRKGEAENLKTRALEILAKLRPEAKDSPFDDSTFQKLVLWMLW